MLEQELDRGEVLPVVAGDSARDLRGARVAGEDRYIVEAGGERAGVREHEGDDWGTGKQSPAGNADGGCPCPPVQPEDQRGRNSQERRVEPSRRVAVPENTDRQAKPDATPERRRLLDTTGRA